MFRCISGFGLPTVMGVMCARFFSLICSAKDSDVTRWFYFVLLQNLLFCDN